MNGMGMMTNGMSMMMSGFGFLMTFLWLVFFAALVGGVFFLVRQLPNSSGKTLRNDRALDTARARFAKGELSADEFREIKQTLEADHS